MVSVERSFAALVAEAAEAWVDGWDFSWLDGRATEERPSWGYQRLLAERLVTAAAALDIETGGGEVLAGAGAQGFPPVMVTTEGWPPNLARATALLHPLGVAVVADPAAPPLPFADEAFDLVTSRHPATVHWSEITRVLAPGGTYFAQHVGGGTNVELSEHFRGPLPAGNRRHHDREAEQARAAGLDIVQCRNERLQLEFFDIGAVVFFLRKVIWTVPNFNVERDRARLREIHDHIRRDGAFHSTMSRTLFEAHRPEQVPRNPDGDQTGLSGAPPRPERRVAPARAPGDAVEEAGAVEAYRADPSHHAAGSATCSAGTRCGATPGAGTTSILLGDP